MFVVLQKEQSWYVIIKREPNAAFLLGLFLKTDVCTDVERYIKEFEDDYEHYTECMNATQYSKHEDGILITPSWIIDEDESIEQEHYVLIKSLVLAELLKQWKPVYLQQPPYILITLDENSSSVTSFNECPIV